MTREELIHKWNSYKGIIIYPTDNVKELINATIKVLEQEPKPRFIAKADGTIEQIKNCEDCIFKKEWEKIGKLLSVVLEKQTEQEPKQGHWIEHDGYWECSECHAERGYGNEYCPDCGSHNGEIAKLYRESEENGQDSVRACGIMGSIERANGLRHDSLL